MKLLPLSMAALVILLTAVLPALAQRGPDIQALNRRYQALYAKGDYAGALIVARKLESTVRAIGGTQHPNYPLVLEFVGNSLSGQGSYAEAEQVHRRVLSLREGLYGVGSAQSGDSHLNIGNAVLRQGRYAEAENYYQRALQIQHRTPGTETSPSAADIMENISVAQEAQGRYQSAEKLLNRVLTINEARLGADHAKVGDTMGKLASLQQKSGRIREAEALFKRALQIQNRSAQNPIPAAQTLNNLGILHSTTGQYSDAEVEFRQALAVQEKHLGRNHPTVAEVMQNLAAMLKIQCRFDEAESLAKRVIEIRETTLGTNHPDLASTLVNLANIYALAKRFDEATSLYQRALAIQQKALGNSHPNIGFTLHNLAFVAEAQKRLAEAETYSRQAVKIHEEALGPKNIEIGKALNNLGNILVAQQRFDEADAAYTRALRIYETTVGLHQPDAALTVHNIARLQAARGNTKSSLEWSRRAVAAVIAASSRATQNEQAGDSCVVQERSAAFTHLLEQARAALVNGIESPEQLTQETYETSQLANHSRAATALQQMARRFAGGGGELADLVREGQDLVSRIRERDKALLSILSKAKADNEAIAQIRRELNEAQQKLTALKSHLADNYPQYAALTDPRPASVKETRALLQPDEVLIVWAVGERQTELFALTSESVEWHSLPISAEAISNKVATLRRGLDVEAVSKPTGSPSDLFDLKFAEEFYKEIFGPAQRILERKRKLLLVPTGALTAVPFQALVTARSSGPQTYEDMDAYRSAHWLIKQNSIVVVPSVSSLKSLRDLARSEGAKKPLVGFGDPVFQPAQPTQPAGKQRGGKQRVAAVQPSRRAAAKTRSYDDFWQGANVDRARLSDALSQLPDSADELKDVAQKLNADNEDVLLGAAANETNLKAMRLVDYRVVYFATHGLVAGDVKGVAEPSLALSLPARATSLDDGLLTASEIAQLKLNADWVVLSACNTAAGDKPGAEALSGLARSFFYAGARALLVSHWAVASDAATALTTSTFAKLSANASLGRAEALQEAMIDYLQDTSRPANAYPAMWAPFVLVGEGRMP